MKIVFNLGWVSAGKASLKSFKAEAAGRLASEYIGRIGRFAPCELSTMRAALSRGAGSRLWLCDRSSGARALSSEEVAGALEKEQVGGCRELHIAVGGADGWTAEETRRLAPDIRWSFGPLTLPHELALVVAGEQIYRALSILNGRPYHRAH